MLVPGDRSGGKEREKKERERQRERDRIFQNITASRIDRKIQIPSHCIPNLCISQVLCFETLAWHKKLKKNSASRYPLPPQFPLLFSTAPSGYFGFSQVQKTLFRRLCHGVDIHYKLFIVCLPLRPVISSTEKSCLGTPLRVTYPLHCLLTLLACEWPYPICFCLSISCVELSLCPTLGYSMLPQTVLLTELA